MFVINKGLLVCFDGNNIFIAKEINKSPFYLTDIDVDDFFSKKQHQDIIGNPKIYLNNGYVDNTFMSDDIFTDDKNVKYWYISNVPPGEVLKLNICYLYKCNDFSLIVSAKYNNKKDPYQLIINFLKNLNPKYDIKYEYETTIQDAYLIDGRVKEIIDLKNKAVSFIDISRWYDSTKEIMDIKTFESLCTMIDSHDKNNIKLADSLMRNYSYAKNKIMFSLLLIKSNDIKDRVEVLEPDVKNVRYTYEPNEYEKQILSNNKYNWK